MDTRRQIFQNSNVNEIAQIIEGGRLVIGRSIDVRNPVKIIFVLVVRCDDQAGSDEGLKMQISSRASKDISSREEVLPP